MRKNRFRSKIKSIVRRHIDPDKDEELKASNIETEDNYDKILELLKEDDQDDKSKLVGLIEEFHKHYQSIYERYDNITGELKEKLQLKKEKDSSSSSSSDSDSDNSPNEKGSKNGKSKCVEIDELKRKLAVETEEKEALNTKCEAALNKVQETEKMNNELKLQADRLLEEKSRIFAENQDLNSKLESSRLVETELNRKTEDNNREKTSLMLENETAMIALDEEKRNNEELQSIIVQLKEEKEDCESELEDVKSDFSKTKAKLIQKLESAELENKSLQKKSEERETEIINLQKELEFIITQKLESDNLLSKSSLEVSEYLIQIERLKEEVANKNLDQENLLQEIEVYKSKMKDYEEETEISIRSKDLIIDQLEETIEDLRCDLEIKRDEVHTLTDTARNLEVKIRLANQKLRVTEQVLNEAERDHATKQEKLHQQNKSLINKIATSSESISAIKREVLDKVNQTLTGFDSLTVKFEEDYGHVTTRVYEIRNEVQATQIQAKQTRSEKDDLKRKVEETATKLRVSEGENERLMKTLENMKTGVLGKDEKIKELESTIVLKDKEISDLSEDKIDAIKQLCIWADYHRDRFDHLQDLLKTTAGGRRQTVR